MIKTIKKEMTKTTTYNCVKSKKTAIPVITRMAGFFMERRRK